jgi:hypothetical protein
VTLFQIGQFVGHSGDLLDWKVECDALTDDDWDCLAMLASMMLPAFGPVEGVPPTSDGIDNGARFAAALRKFSAPITRLLIADDVFTTGRSLEAQRAGRPAIGVVAFSRSPDYPRWVTSVWTLHLHSRKSTG